MRYEYLITTVRAEYASRGQNFDTLELGEQMIILEDKHISLKRENPQEIERLRRRYNRENHISIKANHQYLRADYEKICDRYNKLVDDYYELQEKVTKLETENDWLRDELRKVLTPAPVLEDLL
jgi:predicted nuclease with TOPRIM domain